MVINFYGEGCFKIQTGGLTIVTDPFESAVGLTPPRGKFDVVIKTLSSVPKTEEAPKVHEQEGENIIIGPGEYDVKGIFISGWQLEKDSGEGYFKTVYRVEAEDMALGFLGHISQFNEPEIIEELNGIDILFIPGGGKPFMDQEAASKLVRQINPKLVVPSFFKVKGLKRKADEVTDFLKEIGQKTAAPQEKLTIKKKELPEKTGVIVLSL